MSEIHALLFDFDGLIVDTETPSYESWNEIYREYGHELDPLLWADVISNRESAFDAVANLQALLGADQLDAAALTARRNSLKDQLTDLTQLLPGIRGYTAEARRLGLRLGIASGSSHRWVNRHLKRLGIDEGWDCIRSRDDVPRSKPHPDTYLSLLECLDVEAGEAIAFEDSPNGIASAQAAGIYCVAVPNTLTSLLNLSAADLLLESLADLQLADLLRHVSEGADEPAPGSSA
jgi:beta-phosphoglucomutase-like phosphatase (HAD superfamily)